MKEVSTISITNAIGGYMLTVHYTDESQDTHVAETTGSVVRKLRNLLDGTNRIVWEGQLDAVA